jgi:hypothetical protein
MAAKTLNDFEDDNENNEEENMGENVLDSIELKEKSSLSNPEIPDSRLLSELTENAKPLKELPPDDLIDVYYETRFEPRCALCKSPFKVLAEHVYLNNGWKPHSVMAFFREYFNARVSWDCVDAHMRRHCDFSKMGASGLKKLMVRQDSAIYWQYRELDLAIAGVLDEIDEIKGMNLERRPDMKLKQAMLLRTLYRDLAALYEKRNEASSQNVNVAKLLMDIWGELRDEESKNIIIRKVQEVQRILNDGNKSA